MVGSASRALRLITWVLLRALSTRAHAVVHGWPDDEANAIEVARGLLRRYPGRIYVLQNDPAFWSPRIPQEEGGRLVRLPKNSLAALRVSLRAEVTFFTHGLSTAVDPPGDRLVVNLWHGDGPKSTRQPRLVRSTVVVSGAALWAAYKAELFAVPPQNVLLTGNPRIDQFDEPLVETVLRRFGLNPGRRCVLWMPTYREARGPRDRAWSDGIRLSGSSEVAALATALAVHAEALPIDLVIKPHPLDADSYSGLGCHVVTGEQLNRAGVTLYQLLGHCDALISDVSSAWVDYLVLDRPIGFYMPDLDEFVSRRGLNVSDLPTLVPGPLLQDADQARAFLDEVAGAAPRRRPSSYPGFAKIGPVRHTGATDRLLDALSEFQLRRGRAPLFTSAEPPV